jgi:diguanylate cyclase (GGDEF)-like protein
MPDGGSVEGNGFRVDLWTQGSLKRLLLPGLVLLIAVCLSYGTGLVRAYASIINFYYYAAFAVGLWLAWRFHSTRVFSALIVLLLAHTAVEFFSKQSPVAGLTALEAVAFLLPLNFTLLTLMPERGFVFPAVVSRLGILFVESVFVTLISHPVPGPGSSLFHGSLLNPAWFSGTKIPQIAWLVFAVTLVVLLARFARFQKPVDGGFCWALVSAFLGLHAGAGNPVSTALLGTAAVILVLCIVEMSYLMAYHDELTGLPARRAFNTALLKLEAPYTVAAVDIDHFKQFNDTYGHETGDQVLRMVAARLAQVTGGGQAFRVGGEEFTILFSGKTAKEVLDHLDLLRALIEHSTFHVRLADRRKTKRGPDRRRTSIRAATSLRFWQRKEEPRIGKELSVTVSIGVAEPGPHQLPVEHVLEQADKALYRAKGNGRNRVEMATGRVRSSAKRKSVQN